MYVSSNRKWFSTYSSRKAITFVTSPWPPPFSTAARRGAAVASTSLCRAAVPSPPPDRSSVHFPVTPEPSSPSLLHRLPGAPPSDETKEEIAVFLPTGFLKLREAARPPTPRAPGGRGGRAAR